VTVAATLAASGAVLGGVVVLLAQQFGALPLSELWPTLIAFLLGIVLGGVVLGAVGSLLDRR